MTVSTNRSGSVYTDEYPNGEYDAPSFSRTRSVSRLDDHAGHQLGQHQVARHLVGPDGAVVDPGQRCLLPRPRQHVLADHAIGRGWLQVDRRLGGRPSSGSDPM